MLKKNSIYNKINSLDKNEVLFFSCLILVLSTGWVIAQDSSTPLGTVAGASAIPYEWESDPNAAAPQEAAASGYNCCGTTGDQTGAQGGCGSGSGCGSGGQVDLEELKTQAYEWYVATYGDADVEIDVQDFGCHQELNILKNGQEIKHFVISGGQVTEV